MLRRAPIAVLLLLLVAPAASAAGPLGLRAGSRERGWVAAAGPLGLRAGSRERGWVALTLSGPDGASVAVREGKRVLARITLGPATTVLPHAARWTCTPRRRFSASDGTTTVRASVRTPSCRTRLALSAPRSVRAGRLSRLRVRDTWGVGGFAARFCARPPGHRGACRRVALARGRTQTTVARRFWRKGTWRLVLRTRQGAGRAHVLRVHRIPHLRVLAAGDSMVQIVDDFVRTRIRPSGGAVRFDDHISTGLSKPFLLDWPRHAVAVSRSYRPDVTVMFIGANDGFPFGSVGCCGRAWVRAYAVRARAMMRSYARGGAGRVYWLTLPTPRGGAFRRVFGAVNRALRRAARGLGDVRIVDVGRTISPRGVFVPSVRQADGVHLNVRGASIVAGLVLGALRRDGLL